MAARTSRTRNTRARDWAPLFLEALEREGMVTKACDAASVGRSTVYDRRETDEAFAAAWDVIVERMTEEMESEAHRRAVEGWRERAIFNEDGEEIGEVRKYSDTLLMFLLKARRPDTYRERREVRHSGLDGGPLALELNLSDDALDALDRVLESRPAARED